MAQIQDQRETFVSLKKAQKICRVGFAGLMVAAIGETILAAMGNPWGSTYALIFAGSSVPVIAVGYIVKQKIRNLVGA